MELKETIAMMTSADYKERFRAEYCQVKIRLGKLQVMLQKWEKGELNFTPTCPRDLLVEQVAYMDNYLRVLGVRAYIEGVEL